MVYLDPIGSMHDMEKQKKEEGDEEEDKGDQPGKV